ncbi:hypothetical protein, partial [Frankia sp. AvcI1]
MTLVHDTPAGHSDPPVDEAPPRVVRNLLQYVRTTSHKDIALMYFIVSLLFFAF